MKNAVRQKIDIAVLNEKVEKIETQVNLIVNNHIPHLETEIDKVKIQQAYWAGGITVAVSLINYFLK